MAITAEQIQAAASRLFVFHLLIAQFVKLLEPFGEEADKVGAIFRSALRQRYVNLKDELAATISNPLSIPTDPPFTNADVQVALTRLKEAQKLAHRLDQLLGRIGLFGQEDPWTGVTMEPTEEQWQVAQAKAADLLGQLQGKMQELP